MTRAARARRLTRPLSLRLYAECEAGDVYLLVGLYLDALLARDFAAADEGRVAARRREPVASGVVELQGGVAAAHFRVALDGQVYGDGLRATPDGYLVLEDRRDRLPHAALPDLDAVQLLRARGDLRHLALQLPRVTSARRRRVGRLGRALRRGPRLHGARGDHRVAARLVRLPDGLHAELPLLKRAVYAQLDGERLGRQLRLPRQLARALGEDVIQTLFEPAALLALPLLVVLVREVDDVLGRYEGGAAGRREHLALHDGLDLARDLDEELLPDAARPRLLADLRERVVRDLAVNPTPDRFDYSHGLPFTPSTVVFARALLRL